MKKLVFALILTFLLLSLAAKITVTPLGTNSYKVIWNIPQWSLSTQDEYTSFSVSDFGMPALPGAPLLPFDECKFAVPPGGSISINITNRQTDKMTLEKRIMPVADVQRGDKTEVYQYTINEDLYSETPTEVLTMLPLQRFRNLSFVPVRINPFIYDGRFNLNITGKIEFIVTIHGDVSYRSSVQMDDLTELISKQTLNPVQARQWLLSERSNVNYADFSRSDFWVRIEADKDGMFKINQSQLNMLPVNDIDPRTFRLFTTGGEVHPSIISYIGPQFREVPIFVFGESDGTFNTLDYILFYGRDRVGMEMNLNVATNQYINPYSNNVTYWLTFGGSFDGTPLRIQMSAPETVWDETAATSPESVRIENETFQRLPVGFEWFTGKFFGNLTAEYSYNIDLEDVDTNQPQTLSMALKQEYIRTGSTINHRVRLKVNNQQLLNNQNTVQEWSWIGLSPITITHTGQHFRSGSNNILINVLRTGTDNLFFDFYQVAYQKQLIKRSKQFMVNIPNAFSNTRVRYDFTGNNANLRIFRAQVSTSGYDVTELPLNVVSGGFNFIGSGNNITRFIVAQDADYFTPPVIQSVNPVDLTAVNQAVDNVIITPPDFLQQANSLAAFYQQNMNKRSKVVLLQDVFNQFNGGMPDPNAIRLYMKYCVANYPSPAVTSLTLLGSGTNDWRNHSGQSTAKNKMIVYQIGTVTSEDYFGMINTSQYPEIAVGRYPARTVAEMNIMLSNLQRYVTQPAPGIWKNQLIFLADDQFNGPSTGEYSHSEQLQDTSQMINKSIMVDKIFAIEYEFDEFQNKPRARDDMVAAINEGKLIWYYIGHGSFDTLGAEDYFKGALDIGRFNNPDKLTLFIAASCDVAQFDSFSFDSLSEKVVLLNNLGAIASIAATRECNGPSNVALLKHYYNYSLNLRNPIGYSLLSAKVVYTEYNANDEKYCILGDPLLLVTTPQRDSTIIVETINRDNVLNAREQVTLRGQFPASDLNGTASVNVFDNDIVRRMGNNSPYTLRGRTLFRGSSTVDDSQYGTGFIVPDDVTTGNTGLILSYIWDDLKQKGFINYKSAIALSDESAGVENPDAPQIQLYLNDMDFSSGDIVGTNPLLIAKISDQNGINLTDSPGHSILLILDYTASITNVTSYFAYDKDSFTQGTLNYQLSGLSEGNHTLQLIAFDNFNRPSVAEINFVVKRSKTYTVENFLPYPNPMQRNGWFTFNVSDNSDVTISIYTIRGRKIKTIKTTATKGYNQIAWDGRDADGHYLANNTYFIKLTAKSLSGSGKAEKTEKLVIYN